MPAPAPAAGTLGDDPVGGAVARIRVAADSKQNGWFRELAEPAREAARKSFKLGTYTPPDGPLVRAAQIETGGIVLDPVAVTHYPKAWRLTWAQIPPSNYHAYRTQQVLANRDRMRCSLEMGSRLGTPAYIVANGPSAADRVREIPSRPRDSLVFAINAAADLIEHDYWILGCALYPGEKSSAGWRHRLIGEWMALDHTGAEMVCATYADAELVTDFEKRWGDIHFWHGANRNPYRPLVHETTNLPNLIEGIQSIVATIHLASWLGCGPIFLYGVDQARPIGSERMHAAGREGWAGGGPPEEAWYRQPGVGGGEVETNAVLACAALHVAAISMWLQDAAIPIFNCSAGLDFLFAPHLSPAEATELIADVEEDADFEKTG